MSTFRWSNDGLIKSVIFPAFSTRLEWSGPSGGALPQMVNVGPVSDQESTGIDSDKTSKDLENALSSMGLLSGGFDVSKMSDMNSFMSSIGGIMSGVLDLATHQDYHVSSGDRLSFFGGGGRKEVEKRGLDSYLHVLDIFKWEIRRMKNQN